MTTSPSNETHDEWSDAPTMAGSIPTTMASRTATGFDVTPPTAARPYVPDLAWSEESPEIAEPRSPQRPRRWSMRSGVLTLRRRRRVLRRRLLAGLVGGAMAHRTGWRLLRLISRRRNGIRRCRGGSRGRCRGRGGGRGGGGGRGRGTAAGRGGWGHLQPVQRAEDAGSCGGNEAAADKRQHT